MPTRHSAWMNDAYRTLHEWMMPTSNSSWMNVSYKPFCLNECLQKSSHWADTIYTAKFIGQTPDLDDMGHGLDNGLTQDVSHCGQTASCTWSIVGDTRRMANQY